MQIKGRYLDGARFKKLFMRFNSHKSFKGFLAYLISNTLFLPNFILLLK